MANQTTLKTNVFFVDYFIFTLVSQKILPKLLLSQQDMEEIYHLLVNFIRDPKKKKKNYILSTILII